MLGTAFDMDRTDPFTKIAVSFRTVEKRLPQCSQIKSRPANQYRHGSTRFDLNDLRRCIVGPISDVVIDIRIDIPDQMVRDPTHLFVGRLRRRDLDLAVYLHRIKIDHLATDPQRKRDPESRLARACRA